MSSSAAPLVRRLRAAALTAAVLLPFALSAQPANPPATVPAPPPEPVRGPFWSGTIMRSRNQAAAMKGLAVTLGPDQRSYVVYDLDTMRLAVAWSGEFLEFGNTLTKIEWPPPPRVKGTNVVLETTMGPGWANQAGSFADPRERQQGPLPKDWAHHRGVYVHGDQVVLSYTVGNVGVLEMPGLIAGAGGPVFTRTLQFEGDAGPVSLLIATGISGSAGSADAAGPRVYAGPGGRPLNVAQTGLDAGAKFTVTEDGRLLLQAAKVRANTPFKVLFTSTGELRTGPANDVRPLTKGGPARWTESIVTEGRLNTGGGDGSYVVDTITEPFPNPYNVSVFFGGHDFLPDGRAALCTFHGDVWVVSGLDDTLGRLTWKRFATGLFQPLGLKVVNGLIHVAGRDQITRLHDLNGDGEADFYENFNNDTVVTPNYHEFVLDLHTDSKGNFYYAKGAPWEPTVTSPHQGTILKVSPDGKKLEVFATGLRAPNGMTVGPDDTVLVGDNQGHWMPSSKLNLVRPGAFLGMVPAAQRELKMRYTNGVEITVNPSDPAAREAHNLKGWNDRKWPELMPVPVSYDEPVAWLPMRWDNSSGGQVYVTSDKWGPFKGAPLFMSYGKCLLYAVLMDNVDGTVQATLAPFDLKFASGVMRGRFNDRDGQLYLSGLKGWQNAASRDGGFYRVRYTGKPVRLPVKAHAAQNGIQLTFATELEAKTAEDAESYAVELWDYRYTGNYGSPEVSVKAPGQNGHDKLDVKSAKLSADRKTLFLEVIGLQVADQFSVKYAVNTADGTELRSEIIGTIHKLGAPVALR